MSDATQADQTPKTIPAVMMVYDIPVGAKDKNGHQLVNPSGELRRIGFRANLSCWVLPADSIPWTLINDLRLARVDVDVVKFDASEGPRLARMAIDRMSAEISAQIKRSRRDVERAASRCLADLEITGERDAAQTKYERQAAAVLARLEGLLEDLDAARVKFGVGADQIKLATGREAYAAIQDAIGEKAASYAEATKKLREANTETGKALAGQAARPDAPVPHYVLADALRETGNAGDEEAADRIQAAFDGKPEGEGAGEEDHIFNLTEAAEEVCSR